MTTKKGNVPKVAPTVMNDIYPKDHEMSKHDQPNSSSSLSMLQERHIKEKKAHQTMETRTVCRTCRNYVLLLTSTTANRCPVCQPPNTSFLRHEKSCGNSGVRAGMRRFGAKLLAYEQPESFKAPYQNTSLLKYQQPGSSSSLPKSKKRAVLCGVTYGTTKYRLKGTINDVRNMKELLMMTFDFPENSIRVFTEQENCIRPTKQNILDSLHWLVKDCQSGDSLVFYFSGHGCQQPDLKGDELDGFDESICPVDFLQEGMIVDNDINSILVWPLKKGVTLHAIVDACNSGTILDLNYVYIKEEDIWDDHKPKGKDSMKKHTNGGLAICFSACGDNQMAADTTALSRKGMNGVLTYLFTNTIKENPEITYGGILEKIHEEIQQITTQPRWQLSFLKDVFCNIISQAKPDLCGALQDPILSSSEKFDIFQRKFKL